MASQASKPRTTRRNKTPPEKPENLCERCAEVGSTKQSVRQIGRRRTYPLGPPTPIKAQGAGISLNDVDFVKHPLPRKPAIKTSKGKSSGVESPPPKHPLRSSRAVTNRPLPPRPDIIQETEASLPDALRRTSPARRVSKRKPPAATHGQQHETSPQAESSSVPSLPTVARFAASTESSLERALDAVMKKLEEMEMRQAAGTKTSPAATPKENTEQSKCAVAAAQAPLPEVDSDKSTSKSAPSSKSLVKEPVPPTRPSIEEPPKEPPPDPPQKRSEVSRRPPPLKSPARLPPAAVVEREVSPLTKVEKEPAAPTTQRHTGNDDTDRELRDLDAFFFLGDGGDDDALISDRDVLHGLQVATRAASDDFYDAYVRYRTGLRIRRFLADLRSVDALQLQLQSSRLDDDPRGRGRGVGGG